MKPRSVEDLSELARAAPAEGAPLSELQLWMVEVLRHPRGLSKSKEMTQRARLHFCGNERVSPVAQLDIYRRQFWLRHTNILVDHFPGLTRILGQKAWEPIAESYLEKYGRGVASLGDLGSSMAEHLGEQSEVPRQSLCVDMARLEWAYQSAFVAADDTGLSPEKVASVAPEDWPRAVLSVARSVKLLQLRHPVATLRRALRSETQSVDLEDYSSKGDLYLVVYRREGTLWDKEVSRAAFLLLEQLQASTPLIPACEAVVAAFPEAEEVFDTELAAWFTLWGRLGWIVDVRVPH